MKRQVVKVECIETTLITKAISILNVRLSDRGCKQFERSNEFSNDDNILLLAIHKNLKSEEYSLETLPDAGLKISGGSEFAILYGIGKMLRTASYKNGCFEFGDWRGSSAPQKSFRAMYFATHFFNFYHIAPLESIIKYVEDLALLGYNALMMWVDKHHYNNAEDPEYMKFCERIKHIYEIGALVGLKPIIGTLCNEGFSSTPESLRAKYPGRSFYGCEVCPSTEPGMKLILDNHEETLKTFAGLDVLAYSIWPYDQGGCSCEKCFPWGANGMYKTATNISALVHKYFPESKIIYSTWLFDYRGEKEWEGLYEKLRNEKNNWINYLCADSHKEFPEFPLKNAKPKGIELLNFPEISMWGRFPWGGFGATPLPKRFSRLWGQVCDVCDGGFPYSEGIFEDFNKALYAVFYWNGNNDTAQAMKEYFNYEFGCQADDELTKVIEILEQNHQLLWLHNKSYSKENYHPLKSKRGVWASNKEYKDADIAFKILQDLDETIPEWASKSWRWRILYLRGAIDMVLDENNGEPDSRCEVALKELAKIYHANNKMDRINPITDDYIRAEEERLKKEKHQDQEILKI